MTLRSNVKRASAVICVLLIFLVNVADCSDESWGKCCRICIAQQCDNIGIRYGKYCGLGHTGCPGEKPCDDADACCMKHDDCVGKYGVDYLSAAAYDQSVESHRVFLEGRETILVEGLKLDDILEGIYTLNCLPLRLVGSEASPIRCILIR